MGYCHSNAHLKIGLPPVTDEPFVFCYYEKTAFVIASQKIHVTSSRSATLWKSKHQVFSKTETIIKGLIKVCLTFFRAAQTSRYLISFYYFHFFYLFFLRPYFEKHLDFCGLLYRLRDSSAAGTGTEKTIFFPPLDPVS